MSRRPGYITPIAAEAVVIAESNSGIGSRKRTTPSIRTVSWRRSRGHSPGNTNNIVSVDYMATNGTATAKVNYYATNGTLLFTNGQTSQSFNVYLIANTAVQPNLTALLELSNPPTAIWSVPLWPR